MEILADLKKVGDVEYCRSGVQKLANKLVPACSAVNVGYRDLVIVEIYGHKISSRMADQSCAVAKRLRRAAT